MNNTQVKHAQIAKLTATRCCACRKALTDAESVETGLGPICSGKFYNPQHVPTVEMVQKAIGLLAAAGLPEHIEDGFLGLVNNDHTNARKGSNLLVYWASCNYDNRDEVFKCSRIIRALGYVELADKLEEDRTKATIRKSADGTLIEAWLPDTHTLSRDLKDIPGWLKPVDARGIYLKQGHKVCWTFPKAAETHLWTVLGVHLGGEMSCGSEGLQVIPRKRWSDLRAITHPVVVTVVAPATTLAPVSVVPSTTPNFSKVYTPYNVAFIGELKNLPYKSRRWDSVARCWLVENKHRAELDALLAKHFGVQPQP
jgi:hypothetical protein